MAQMVGTKRGRSSPIAEEDKDDDVEDTSLWAVIERLPTFERLRSSLFDINNEGEVEKKGRRVVDVTKLRNEERRLFVHKLIKNVENDNLKLLTKVRDRIHKVGEKFPSVEVKYKNVHIEAECEVVHGKAIPTLWNALQSKLYDIIKFCGVKSHKAQIYIIEDASGVIKPGRLTLLLGPPGCGKTTLLKALSGNLNKSLKISGEICYNGHKLEEFVPQKTSAYVSQHDLHIPQMTVKETLDFSARCQGIGSRADIMKEVNKKEKEEGMIPNPDIDTYMKAISIEGLKQSLQTDYTLKILGLDICGDTQVGDAMRRGISGGQKKRLTTGEMMVGPNRVLFMDEITNGLDSSTAFQIVSCLQNLTHITDATILVSLLQPAPETFQLFDDLILMAQKKIIYHGRRDRVLEFFEHCGFKCPKRKSIADFVQEVISQKDQPQFWYCNQTPYAYICVDTFSRKFKCWNNLGRKMEEEILKPFDEEEYSKNNGVLLNGKNSVSKWQVFKACASTEFLLMRRNSFVYIFKTCQLFFIASITMTVFVRTQMKIDLQHGSYYMGALFYSLIILLVDALPELSMTIQRLEVFYKHRELLFYPAWAYVIPPAILKLPLSFVQSLVWTSLTYYVIGYTPEVSRFFRHFLVLFAVHVSSLSMFRMIALVNQHVVASTLSSFVILQILIFGGFIITHPSMSPWLQWGFWLSPISYGEIGLSINEFLAPRWQKVQGSNSTIGHAILESRGLDYHQYFYWISLAALFGFAFIFNVGFALALTFLNSPGSYPAIISYEKLSQSNCNGGANSVQNPLSSPKTSIESTKGGIALPFTPLTVVFQDLQYYVDMPSGMRERGFTEKKLQLLSDITGALRPGILTALMGVSGAGKTTLLDVLAGRKTSGYIEGEIKIGGFPKVQETFARVSGYCEQTDIHSSLITVEESLIFSATLRLAPDIDSKTKAQFVNEVLETIELDSIKDSLVGIPGVSGLSTEQRKRLTIAVELVSNPSIIFMDEPTTGLDARAAAIVMRAVKNVADTGRTIVCTIHQPSIDIFESFDELILLKTGGHMIYYGPLGHDSSKVIEYFEHVPGVSKIRENYNPATWMLEVTSSAAEAKLGIDFAEVYKNSALYENNKELVKQLSAPPPGSRDLHFSNVFAQNFLRQFGACLWKQNLSYWRNPRYNLLRILHTIASSLIFGILFWKQGKKLENQQNLFNNFGLMYSSVIFLGIYNCSSVFPNISRERTVMYRERFAGMYSSGAYSLAQVIIEVPYIFVQTAIYVIITYPMIGFYGSAWKIFWCFYSMFCALLYFKNLGLLLVSITPNYHIATILSSAFYVGFNLFAGFLVPKPRIPKWWIWFYYMIPTSWTLNCLLTSQYGDIDKTMVAFGERTTVSTFLRDYFGFHHNQLPLVSYISKNMAPTIGESEPVRMIEVGEIGRRSFSSSLCQQTSSFKNGSTAAVAKDDDVEDITSLWELVERLPMFERLRSSLFDDNDNGKIERRVVDVTKLGDLERHLFIKKLINNIENDNLKLLKKVKERIHKVGVKFATVEVKYKNVNIEAKCEVVRGKALPTLWNSLRTMLFDIINFCGVKSNEAKISIIEDLSGVIKPGRLTLLLGPPGCGKTTLLKALSGNLNKSLKMTGEICYNRHKLEKIVPQKFCAYISQYDLHIPEMTVRETLDFSAKCKGIGNRADMMKEVCKREKEQGVIPDPDVDTYMKATSVEGLRQSLQTDYILKILGLDICADTIVGDAMRRGISGGQKKRLTTGEMMVGPYKGLFMDEITNGLDSSTAFQVVSCLQHLAHFTNATILISLLQPSPETFQLFDDLILMSEKKIVYQGRRDRVLEFFEHCGFKCPNRKGVADFLQEVISRKDQAQFWYPNEETPYSYVSVDEFCRKFKCYNNSDKKLVDEEAISRKLPFEKSKSCQEINDVSSTSKWEVFKACASRELLLIKRNSFLYVFKICQLFITGLVTMTVFLRTEMEVDVEHGNYYMGALFFALILLLVDGFPELAMTIQRLEVFYKQKEFYFYPAWAYAIPAAILKIPLSLVVSLVWTSLTYYVIGFTPQPIRFFQQFILQFAVHLSSLSMYRMIASIFQTIDASMAVGNFAILFALLFGGFIISHSSMPAWLEWGFWVSPISYGEIGLSLNEFLAPRWQKVQSMNTTIGHEVLQSRGLDYPQSMYWISLATLFGFALIFNIVFVLALTFLKPPGSSRAIISYEKLSQSKNSEECNGGANSVEQPPFKTVIESTKGRIALPFTPLTVVFQDLQYYVDMPLEMKERGSTQKKLQLLSDITGALRPGVLTALMGVSGAGKTTLLDVLAGRKTSGYIEGEIKIGGFPKVQQTFARISGYCEQTDIHSPQITVEESLIFSASLRLASDIDSKTKQQFVNEVLETIELDGIKDMLVGIPGVSGLSTEQRKRLTIAVELVSNPSIIFMDEPTTGLDARAAAIVMRAVKNVVDTGRTIVCTIHQPSIDIFESFDELILLKTGGRMIYCGPLGQCSRKVIEYFEHVPGVSKMRENYNPATWMLEVTSPSTEDELGIDFAQVYNNSALYENNKDLVKQLGSPPPGSRDLHFSNVFSQSFVGQFKACYWKQNMSYWRSPSYNLLRLVRTIVASFIFGILFWKQGKEIENQQNLFNVFGSMYTAVTFLGIDNFASVLPYVSMERTVMYRERFAGMYSPWAYSLAQVIVEVPYIFIQAATYVIITYPMIGYYGSTSKVLWCFYSLLCALLCYNYLGMLLVSITPNFHIANILSSAFYTILNLFSGFLVPSPQIPKWWKWMYYITPTSWTLNCLLTSQYGDLDSTLVVFEEKTTVSAFLRDYFGFHHNQLPFVGLILILFPLVFALFFGFCIGKLNFQKR